MGDGGMNGGWRDEWGIRGEPCMEGWMVDGEMDKGKVDG